MRFIGLICLAPWLAGCLATRPPASAPAPVAAPVVAAVAPAQPAGAKAPRPAQKTKPLELAPAPRVAAVIAPPPPPPQPARLMGLGAAELSKLLGVPARVRRERRARIWQYVTEDCVLDLFLYPAAGGHVVTHIESRAPKLGRAAAAATCIAGVVRRR